MTENAPLTVTAVYQQWSAALGLRWPKPGVGGDNRLDLPADPARPAVGYLNFINPPRVQIIGAGECAYLAGARESTRANIIQRIATGGSALVIVADGQQLAGPFNEGLHTAGVAVLATELPAHRVIYRVGHELERILARQTVVHGVFLEIFSLGVLITGQPAVGKSELALELITRGHRLVADDAAELALRGPDNINGGCPPLLQDFLEVRGLGVLDIRAMFGEAAIKRRKQLGLIIHMLRPEDPSLPETDRLSGSRRTREILEVPIPEITLPVAPGHNLAVLVEAACRDHLLRVQGQCSDQVLAARQAALLSGRAA